MSKNRWYNDRTDEVWHNLAAPGNYASAGKTGGTTTNAGVNTGAVATGVAVNTGKTGGTSTNTGKTGGTTTNQQVMVNSNLNPNNLTAGLAQTNAGTASVQLTPYIPASYSRNCWDNTQCPSTLSTYNNLSTNSCPPGTTSQEPNCYINEVPGYNDVSNPQSLTSGVTNSGTAPGQGCPCGYEMNCWSQQCPSTLTTYAGLSSPTCPAYTQETTPNCQVNTVPGYNPNVSNSLTAGLVNTTPEVQATYSTATPTTYNMNCWSQQCPSTLSTYTNQASATCPAYTQATEIPCMVPANQNMSAFSGNGW